MKISRTISSVRRSLKKFGHPCVLVPTMGALHDGHSALIRQARCLAGAEGCVVVSIFVNPTQFGPLEDFSKYPRTFAADRARCLAAGADLIFAPTPQEMYFPDASIIIEENSLSLPLCGGSRPGHFRGVCTVVAKLFNIVSPDIAIFGEKDWQQLAVIRRMVRDLDFPIKIIAHSTVREPSGLAISSRNAYLSASRRTAAAALHASLLEAAAQPSPEKILATAKRSILAQIPDAAIDYIEIRNFSTLAPITKINKLIARTARIFAAIRLDGVRLIDNIPLLAKRDAG